MIHIIIGIVIGVIMLIWFVRKDTHFGLFFYSFSIGACAFLMSITITMMFFSASGMEHFSETYRLEKMEANQYYQVNTEGNSVSVYVADENFKEKMTFPEEVVKFNSYANEASIQIEGEKEKEISESKEFWLGIQNSYPKENEYEKVIISVPEGSEVAEFPNTENTDKKTGCTGGCEGSLLHGMR